MKKLATAALVVLACGAAHADFLTGFIVGSSLSNTPDKKVDQATQVITSNTGDVIVCREASAGFCRHDAWTERNKVFNPNSKTFSSYTYIYPTPQQFALELGYSKLHRIGYAFANGEKHIVMEVSK